MAKLYLFKDGRFSSCDYEIVPERKGTTGSLEECINFIAFCKDDAERRFGLKDGNITFKEGVHIEMVAEEKPITIDGWAIEYDGEIAMVLEEELAEVTGLPRIKECPENFLDIR